MSFLAAGLSFAVLVGIFGKLAIDHHSLWQNAEANNGSAEIDNRQKVLENNEITAKATKMHWRSKITFQKALQIAEAAIGGKAYGVERETEGGKPVIEVGIDGQEVFVDAETGEIVLIDNLRQKGDREDIEEITKALELQRFAVVTIQAALQAGESFAGNQAHSVSIENEDGNIVYEVVVGLQKVFIDAGNGQVISTKAVGQAKENAYSTPEVHH
jgi:uncharacterized membrane protein YkoI